MGNVDSLIAQNKWNRLTFPIFKVGNLDLGNVYRTPPWDDLLDEYLDNYFYELLNKLFINIWNKTCLALPGPIIELYTYFDSKIKYKRRRLCIQCIKILVKKSPDNNGDYKLGLNWAKLSSRWDWTLIKSNIYLVSLYLIW